MLRLGNVGSNRERLLRIDVESRERKLVLRSFYAIRASAFGTGGVWKKGCRQEILEYLSVC